MWSTKNYKFSYCGICIWSFLVALECGQKYHQEEALN